jgi:hypothetical protein
VVSATLIEARKITDKRHGYRGRVNLIDLGNGSEKARINSRLISGGWPFPMGSDAKSPFQVPELFEDSWGARPGENNVCFGTVNGLKSDTAPSPKSANNRPRTTYVFTLARALRVGGHAIIGTFALDGPERCSGLPVVRYDAASLGKTLGPAFRLIETRCHEHLTPMGGVQRFQFSWFETAE